MKRAQQKQRSPEQSLEILLRGLKIPSFVSRHQEAAMRAEKEGWSFGQYLHHLAELEHEDRRIRRIERALHRSALPAEKTLATLELDRFPAKVRRQVPTLCEGGFIDHGDNVLAFGLPGRGKTHLLCAIGHELIQQGWRVLFCPAFQLVQRLLMAKRDLLLEKALRRLDAFDLVIVDDIGYVQQDRDEMEVLFTFFGERYERRSVAISSNLVFSQWDRIFKDPMTTAAAVDRLVHHSTILELNCRSYRGDEALANNEGLPSEPPEEAS
jgi:DNA replication protein DnaC